MNAGDDSVQGLSAALSALGGAMETARSQAEMVLQDVKAAQGLDDREVVTVTIDAGCHIVDVSLAPRWRHKRGPEEVGEAIGEGCEAARQAQDAALARLVYEAFAAGVKPQRRALPFGLAEVFGLPTRTVETLAGDFLDHQARDAGRTVFGRNESETVIVQADQRGFVLCDAQPRWADRAENWEIAGGVVEASEKARELVEQEAEKPDAALDIAYDAVRILWQCK